MDNQNGNGWFTVGTMRCGLLLGMAGAAVAFMLIFLGFFKTLLVAVLFTLGYWIGARSDKAAVIKSTINRLFPPKGE
jgi:uncharacterized membrane protein